MRPGTRTAVDACEADASRRAFDLALATLHEADLSWLSAGGSPGGWALAPDGLALLARLVPLLGPRHVLEFGSGESTRVLARAALELGHPCVVSVVEHDPRFAAATTRRLEADGTSHATRIQFAPLVARRRFGALVPVYRWDRSRFAASEPADLVLIDGPPRVLGGREGTLYQALEASRVGTLILLDDAGRAAEAAVIEKWNHDLSSTIDVEVLAGFERGMAAIFVRDLRPVARQIRRAGCASDPERRKDQGKGPT